MRSFENSTPNIVKSKIRNKEFNVNSVIRVHWTPHERRTIFDGFVF